MPDGSGCVVVSGSLSDQFNHGTGFVARRERLACDFTRWNSRAHRIAMIVCRSGMISCAMMM